MASIDKPLPNDDPNVTLTIRLIMQGKVRKILSSIFYINFCLFFGTPFNEISIFRSLILRFLFIYRNFLINSC